MTEQRGASGDRIPFGQKHRPFAPAVAAVIHDATGAWLNDLLMIPERIHKAISKRSNENDRQSRVAHRSSFKFYDTIYCSSLLIPHLTQVPKHSRKIVREQWGPSSLRWSTDEFFRQTVEPIHIKRFQNVRKTWYECWAVGLRKMFEALDLFKDELHALEALAKPGVEQDPDFQRRCINLGISGETLLLYQHHLAVSEEASDFLAEKDPIQHYRHQLHRPTRFDEYENLIRASRRLADAVEEAIQKSDQFILDKTADLDEPDGQDFYLARDLFSVGMDEPGVILAARGFERVLCQVLRERKVLIENPKSQDTRAACEASLYDVIEVLSRLRWQRSNELFLRPAFNKWLQWLRELRNDGAHDSWTFGMSPRDIAPLLAESANDVWKMHRASRRKPLVSRTIRKNWA